MEELLDTSEVFMSPYNRTYTLYLRGEAIGTSQHELVYMPQRSGMFRHTVTEHYAYEFRPDEIHQVEHNHSILSNHQMVLTQFHERTTITDQNHALNQKIQRVGYIDHKSLFLTIADDQVKAKEREIYLYLKPYSSLIIEYYLREILSPENTRERIRFFNCGSLAYEEEILQYRGQEKTQIHDQQVLLHHITARNRHKHYTYDYYVDDLKVIWKVCREIPMTGNVEMHLAETVDSESE